MLGARYRRRSRRIMPSELDFRTWINTNVRIPHTRVRHRANPACVAISAAGIR